MKLSDLQRMEQLDHLTSHTEESLILRLGLYDIVLIDTSIISTDIVQGTGDTGSVLTDEVSPDVKQLHRILQSDAPIDLPCPHCRRNQPHKPVGWFNPKAYLDEKVREHESHKTRMISTAYFGTDNAEDEMESRPVMERLDYRFGSNEFIASPSNIFDGKSRKKLIEHTPEAYYSNLSAKCMQGLLRVTSEIRKDYVCTMNSQHRCSIGFLLTPAVIDKPEELIDFEKRHAVDSTIEKMVSEQEAEELYNKYKHCLLMQKVEQQPSMFDMQYSDSGKYIKVLGDHYKDYTRSLLLSSHGIGVGSVVYLRRIFESIVEEVHQECIREDSNWNEKEYTSLHFDQKIQTLENLGKEIIPTELKPIKKKLYGVLSMGVHQLSEEECNKLYPDLKDAIDIFLDAKIAKMQREKKIREVNKRIQKVAVE